MSPSLWFTLLLSFFCYSHSFLLNAQGPHAPSALEVADQGSLAQHLYLASAFSEENWDQVAREGVLFLQQFPSSPLFPEVCYWVAVAYSHLDRLELTNQYLSLYLRQQTSLPYFREAFELKFQLAEKFKAGYKTHLGGRPFLPKWSSTRQDALKIYEEIVLALPHDDLAVQAFLGKAAMLLENDDYADCLETYQTIIRHFPRHALTPDAYVGIGTVYLKEAQNKSSDSSCLDLASINLRAFQHHFPGDKRLTTAAKLFSDMEEVYAHRLREVAQFYERIHKPHASILYYTKMIQAFPNTESAAKGRIRLQILVPTSMNQEPPIEHTASSSARLPSS